MDREVSKADDEIDDLNLRQWVPTHTNDQVREIIQELFKSPFSEKIAGLSPFYTSLMQWKKMSVEERKSSIDPAIAEVSIVIESYFPRAFSFCFPEIYSFT